MIPFRIALLTGSALFLALLATSSVDAQNASSIPAIAIEKHFQDFGTAQRGQVVRQTFPISNEGSAALLISAARFSMPGMSMRVTQRIEPGQTASLEVEWDTSGYSGDVRGQVTLETNDPKRPQVVLELAGTVLSPIDILPVPAFYLSQFRGQSEAQSITIENNQDRDIEISRIEYDNTLFSVLETVLEAGKRFRLTATVSPDAPLGRHFERIVVHTDDPDNPRLGIQANILVKPDVHLSENGVDFGQVSVTSLRRVPDRLNRLTQSIIVSRRQGTMNITGFTSDLPFLVIDPTPKRPSQRFRVDVGLDLTTLNQGEFSGLILLRTDDDRFAELQIPVRIRVVD